MPIELNTSNNLTELLTNSTNRIQERIDKGLIDSIPIVIADLNQIPALFPSNDVPTVFDLFSRILGNSFGATQPKIFLDGERRHLLVINTQLIEIHCFSDLEVDAVIAHELGHILNTPTNRNIENPGEQKEFYADYFVKSIGLREPLISTMYKYLKQENAENEYLFKLRIEKLNSNEIFQGHIKPL